MNSLEFSIWIAFSSLLAGLLGSLTGLGGGVVIVPVLTILFHVDIHYAIGASLVSVIATSSGAAAAYVREGFSNIRIGMLLEIATTLGALLGAYLTAKVSGHAIGMVFGVVLLYSAWATVRMKHNAATINSPDRLAAWLRLSGDYPASKDEADGAENVSGDRGRVAGEVAPDGKIAYSAQHVPAGFGLMFVAGTLSGLLGIGSGAVKVLAMDQAMKLPFKVSTTTSNFMIGVTAAASAGIYLSRGYILPGLAMPVMLGVLAGSLIGARLLARMQVHTLRIVFSIVIVMLGLEMIYSAARGSL
ncbi:MAG TPA: sulfite exporter TauE/SafE family protein [Acidisarcina sp.]